MSSNDKVKGTNGNTTDYSGNIFQLNLEAMFLFTPMPHAAFVLGPVLDYGLSASQKTGQPTAQYDNDVKVTTFGVTAGVLTFF
jgi:hypothetical protein